MSAGKSSLRRFLFSVDALTRRDAKVYALQMLVRKRTAPLSQVNSALRGLTVRCARRARPFKPQASRDNRGPPDIHLSEAPSDRCSTDRGLSRKPKSTARISENERNEEEYDCNVENKLREPDCRTRDSSKAQDRSNQSNDKERNDPI